MEKDHKYPGNTAKEKDEIKLNVEGETVIPVIEEHLTVDKEVVETGKVYIRKKVLEEEATINIPVVQVGYTIERKPAQSKLLEVAPGIRTEGDTMIIPVVREVLVVEKRYEVFEEVHVIKSRNETPHIQQVTLLKEQVEVERVPTDHEK